MQQIYFLDSTNGFIAGEYNRDGLLFKTTDGGFTWNEKNKNNALSFFGLKVFQSGVGYVAMESLSGGTVLKTTDFGETWDSTLYIYNNNSRVRGLCFIDEENGWAITFDSLFKTMNGGKNWEKSSLGIPSLWNQDVFFTDRNIGFICGIIPNNWNLISKIYKSTDGGNKWESVFEEEHKFENAYQGIKKLYFTDKLGIGVGRRDTATLFITTDNGESWKTKTVKDSQNAYGFLHDGKIINDSLIITVGSDNQIARTTDFGNSWILNYNWNDITLLCTYFLNNKIGWAGGTGIYEGSHGAHIIKTTDSGLTWSELRFTTLVNESHNRVKNFTLYQNYPNPFNPTTKIKYQIPKASFITLKVYDLLGREVATLVNEEKPVGSYEVEFDGIDLSSGIYFYKLSTESYSSTKKMILLK